MSLPPLTIHHLQYSQSERIVWLAEELDIPYNLVLHQRAPIFSPESVKALHPLGQAPVIQAGDCTLAESGACAEFIIHKYGGGRLALPPSHPRYADYLYWFHAANGNLQSQILRLFQVQSAAGEGWRDNMVYIRTKERWDLLLKFIDDRLGEDGVQWLAGEEFTAADIMTVFSLTTMRCFFPLDLSAYGNILAWLRRCTEREGWRLAMEKGDPELLAIRDELVAGKPPTQYMERLKRQQGEKAKV